MNRYTVTQYSRSNLLKESHSLVSDMKLWELEVGKNIIFNHGATQRLGQL